MSLDWNIDNYIGISWANKRTTSVKEQRTNSCDSGYGSVESSAFPSDQPFDQNHDFSFDDLNTSVPINISKWPNVYRENESRSRSPTDQKSTPLSIPEYDHGTTIGTRAESDSSDDTASPSPENDAWLTVTYVKHRMMVSLMRDVYAIFDPHWKSEVRSHAGDQAASTGAHAQNSISRALPSTGKGKWRLQDRDSPPPDGNDEKKRKTKSSNFGDDGQERLFACCFHKHNAQKYCSNGDTRLKYRSCAGPGFRKISKLKQHLKRVHRAPPYCPRCWLVLENHVEMALHLNTEERCRQQEPQILEGVDEEKMRLITETWGVSWEGIYEILFPGAPIPSPYYEAQHFAPVIFDSSSPGSRELRDFEVYNRATLPLLVEANLRAIVESQVAPIEERVRTMVVDIVRTCQSTVARNFHLTIAPTSQAHDRITSSPQASSSYENATHTYEEPIHDSAYAIAGNSLDFFREPSLLTGEASASLPIAMYNHSNSINSQSQSQDSGYGTLTDTCDCLCHRHSTLSTSTIGCSNCPDCALNHSKPDVFDFDAFEDICSQNNQIPFGESRLRPDF